MNSGFVYGLAIPKANTNTQGALTIAYLLAGEGPSQLISQALGLPSARRDVLSKSATGNDELFAKQALLMRSWIDPDPEKTNVIFRDMIQNVTSGALKQSEAIQRADRALGDAAKDL